jgi:hypothetical protein
MCAGPCHGRQGLPGRRLPWWHGTGL